jgi:hypothetical protein
VATRPGSYVGVGVEEEEKVKGIKKGRKRG